MKGTLILFSILVFAIRLCGQNVVINEVMAKNNITIESNSGKFIIVINFLLVNLSTKKPEKKRVKIEVTE